MTQAQINKTKRIVIPTFLILFAIGIAEGLITSNEVGLTGLILSKLLIPLLILSTAMSGYWILLTDDFWDLYEGLTMQAWTFVKTILKFLVWTPGMGLCFYAVTLGFLSIYNRTAAPQVSVSIVGEIVAKDEFRSKYYFEVYNHALGRKVEIQVNEREYDNFNIGDKYQTARKIGALGFIYEMRF